MTASLDPHLAWLDTVEFGVTPSMYPFREGHHNEHPSRTNSALTTSSASNKGQFLSPNMKSDVDTTPERKRLSTHQGSPTALWDGGACHSPPSHHPHQIGTTTSFYTPISSFSNYTSPSNSRLRLTDSITSPLQSSSAAATSALYTNFDLPWTPRRLQHIDSVSDASASTTASSFNRSSQAISSQSHELAVQHIPQKSSSQLQMPPPPLPVRPATVQHPSTERVANALAQSNASHQIAWHAKDVVSDLENRRAWQNDLPPQFRALYNASTVGPFQDIPNVIVPAIISYVHPEVSKKFICNQAIIRRIASSLSEKDAFSFAMSSATIYVTLNRSWWITTFPSQAQQPDKLSAWAYIWPNSQGWCHFCLRWTRIVLHTPSKAHVCLDCIQLPVFRVIPFAAAQAQYKLDNRGAFANLGLLPTVQDATTKLCFYWVCHIEWLEGQYEVLPQSSASPSGKKTVRKRKMSADKTKSKATSRGKGKKSRSSANSEPGDLPQAEQAITSTDADEKLDKGGATTKIRISLRGRGRTVSSSSRKATKNATSSDNVANRPLGGDLSAVRMTMTSDEDAYGETDDELLSALGKRSGIETAVGTPRNEAHTRAKSGIGLLTSESGYRGCDGSPARKRVLSSSAAIEKASPEDASTRYERRTNDKLQILSPVVRILVDDERALNTANGVVTDGGAKPLTTSNFQADQFVEGRWRDMSEQNVQKHRSHKDTASSVQRSLLTQSTAHILPSSPPRKDMAT